MSVFIFSTLGHFDFRRALEEGNQSCACNPSVPARLRTMSILDLRLFISSQGSPPMEPFLLVFLCCDPWYKKGHKKDPRNKIAKDSPRRCTKSFTRYKSMFPAGASSSVRNFSYFRLFWQRRLLVCVDGSHWISVSQEIAWFSMLS